MARPPRIVAELGRPETPDESAARKAEASRKHRTNQTVLNLVLALAASLGVVLLLVLVVVRPDPPAPEPVDYAQVAEQAQPGVTEELAAPSLPAGWTANAASLDTDADESATWTIGFITPKDQFIALEQGIETTPGWLEDFLGAAEPTGSTTIGGIEWQVFDRRDSDDPGNFAYSLAVTVGGSSYLLHGTAADDEFGVLAAALAVDFDGADIERNGA